jgi:dsDNA-specific endonuclease/ATPase MutS2
VARRRDPGHGPDELDADLITEPIPASGGDGEPVALPITAELDLHTFLPRDCADVVAEYLGAARVAGLAHVRIIHGKGDGTLRRSVHAALDRQPAVRSYRLADERGGSWGATLVELDDGQPTSRDVKLE